MTDKQELTCPYCGIIVGFDEEGAFIKGFGPGGLSPESKNIVRSAMRGSISNCRITTPLDELGQLGADTLRIHIEEEILQWQSELARLNKRWPVVHLKAPPRLQ